MALHIIKLCVGCDTVEALVAWHAAGGLHEWRVSTRMTPKRAAEVTAGGSLYRVFKGMVLCRQRIAAIETVGAGPAARCEFILDPAIVRVAPTPRRPFQGWRYLRPEEAPPDLADDVDGDLPPELALRLREAGVW